MTAYTEINEQVKLLDIQISKLQTISDALYTVGNETLAYRIQSISNHLIDASEAIGEANDNALQGRFEETQQASANMVNAALAMAGSQDTDNE